jgi:uncharacterized phage protein gp47/JayE
MFESYTFEKIMKDMLARVPASYDKREGAVIYDAIAPVAAELAQAYISLDALLNETFADTASLEYLEKRAAEKGLTRIAATYAVLQAEFTPASLEIAIGTRFNHEALNYEVIEKISDGVYRVQCETAGTVGNASLGTLIPIDYIDGLETAKLTEVLVYARDAETVEELRERYIEAQQTQAFGGNVADYKEKVLNLDDIAVGSVKVDPVWNGGGTVKLTITDAEYKAPTDELVEEVQTAIDPVGHSGKGYGLAPIGHVVTVVGAEAVTIDIVSTISYETGWSWDASKEYIKAAIDEYFADLGEGWADTDAIVVRVSQIENKILGCRGVLDVGDTTINGATKTLQLESNQIPARGTVNGE